MAINVTLGEVQTQEEKPFPKLMILSVEYATNRGMIILFISKGSGTVIANPVNYKIGHYSDRWAMDHFEDYNEPITLQNA